MPRARDDQNPARIDLPPEVMELLGQWERRVVELERLVAELMRQPWQADIAAVRASLSSYSLTTHNHTGVYSPTSHTHSWSDLTSGVQPSPPPHSHAWSDLTSGVPATFAPSSHSHAWGDLTSGVPLTFTPSSHNHNWADITTGTQPTPSHSHDWTSITSKPTTFAPATHGNEAHTTPGFWPYNPIPWSSLTGVPSTFTPSAHGNSAHTSNFATITHYHTHQDVEPDTGGTVTVKNTSTAL